VLLCVELTKGARRNTNKILDHLKSIEKANFHVSLSYFWIQMVSYYLAVVSKGKSKTADRGEVMKFDDFFMLKECEKLHDSLLYEEYYSRTIIDNLDSMSTFTLPDRKPFPSIL